MTMLMIFGVEAASVEPRSISRDSMDPRETARNPEPDPERERCYWRSRRGLLELDLLLPPFVKARFDWLSSGQRAALQQLLACEDQDIWDWYQRRAVPDGAALAEIVELVRAFNDRSPNGD
jgi:antitoxin CptB